MGFGNVAVVLLDGLGVLCDLFVGGVFGREVGLAPEFGFAMSLHHSSASLLKRPVDLAVKMTSLLVGGISRGYSVFFLASEISMLTIRYTLKHEVVRPNYCPRDQGLD